MQGLGGDQLTHPALEGETAVATTAPGGDAGALGTQVLQVPPAIAQLPVEEAATVSQEGVVAAELIAVVPQRQQGGARLESAIGGFQILIADGGRIEAELGQQIIVAEAQPGEWEAGRLHHFPVVGAETLARRFEGQGQQRIRTLVQHPGRPWLVAA